MSITIVSKYWEHYLLAIARVLLMTGLYVVTGVLLSNQNSMTSPRFPTGVPMRNETDSLLVLPAACFQSDQTKLVDTLGDSFEDKNSFFVNTILHTTPSNKIQGWNFYVLILLWYGVAIISEAVRFFLRSRSKAARPAKTEGRACGNFTWRKLGVIIFRLYQAGGIGLSFAAIVLGFRYIMRLRAWMDRSGWIKLNNGINPENDPTSFGQLVAIFLSALTVFAFIGIVNGNCSFIHTSLFTGRKHADGVTTRKNQQSSTLQKGHRNAFS
jgi:hypothetical protein